MNQEAIDLGWQQMQTRINQMVGRFLKEDYPIIEYKPLHIGLLPLPAIPKEENIEDAA
jgi:hypothetical protein